MILSLIVILAMLLFSAYFSGTEIVFNTVNRIRLRNTAETTGKTVYRVALDICEHFTETLCTILIGNNLVNIAASTAATVLFWKLIPNEGVSSIVSTLVMTFVVLIFGEIIPKISAREHADALIPYVTWPIRVLTWIFFPLVFVVMACIRWLRKRWTPKEKEPTYTEEELSSLIDTVEEEGVIDEDQGELLQSTITFQDTTVEEVMTHRVNMIYLDIEEDADEVRRLAESSKFSRIPVFEDTVDNIIGILHLNRYFKALISGDDVRMDRETLRSLLMEPIFLHKTMKLPAALTQMREKKSHIAIVVDEFGGTLGVVTMEDILEELVGDIWDENDEIVTEITCLSPGKYVVSGNMNIDDFFAEIGCEPENFECEYTTVGGWAIERLEADPHVGDTFTCDRIHAKVTEMDDLRVVTLSVYVEPKKTEEENF